MNNKIKKILLGVSGDAGSFSEEAALLYAERENINPSLIYLIDMEGVLEAVETGKVDMGIFPVVNLQGGLVMPAFAAMGKHLFLPIDEFWLDVQQCLLAIPGVDIKNITKIISHPQALAQCKQYLKTEHKDAELIPWIDTAKAARELSEGHFSPLTAVLAPARAANLYHLEVIAKNIQDAQSNLTAFILAKKRED